MNRYLRPDKFDIGINAPAAPKQWTYRLQTLNVFLKRMGADEADKLDLFTNSLSSYIKGIVSECQIFDSANETLPSLYVCPMYFVFARTFMPHRNKKPGRMLIDSYKAYAKNCDFRPVSTGEYRNVLITELQSNFVRTRLMEHPNLDFQTTYNMVRSLESAEKQSQSCTTECSVFYYSEETSLPCSLLVRQVRWNQTWLLYTKRAVISAATPTILVLSALPKMLFVNQVEKRVISSEYANQNQHLQPAH